MPEPDRLYLRDQRNRSGQHGAYQLGSIDRTAPKEKVAQSPAPTPKPGASSPAQNTSNLSGDGLSAESAAESAGEDPSDPNFEPGGSTRGCASLANALFEDLRDSGLLNIEPVQIILDKGKVFRQMNDVKDRSTSITEPMSTQLVCIGVDGRKDKNTLIYREVS